MNLGGSLTRQSSNDRPTPEMQSHIVNIGQLVEEMENMMRTTLNEIYFGKTKDVVNDLRSLMSQADRSKQKDLRAEIESALKGRMKQN
jgi:capping protein beta